MCDAHNINVCHINIRSLSGIRFSDVNIHIRNNYDIITLSETWLNNNISNDDLTLEGYQEIYRLDRSVGSGGGVAIYVRNGIAVKNITPVNSDLECIWLEVRVPLSRFILCSAYRPPTDNLFWDKIQDNINDFTKQYNNKINFILLGDFNSHPETTMGKCMKDFCNINNLTYLISEPTRTTALSSTILDQIICSCPDRVKSTRVDPPVSSNDHCTVSATFNFKLNEYKAYDRYVWIYKDADFHAFRVALLDHDWSECFSNMDPNSIYTKWKDQFLDLAKSYIPYKKVKIRPKDPPWYDNNLRILYRHRRRLYRKAVRTKCPDMWAKYVDSVETYNKACTKQENNYNINLANKLVNNNITSKNWWKISKSFLYGEKNSHSIPNLIDPNNNDSILSSPSDKAEHLNNFFLSQMNLPENRPPLPEFERDNVNTLNSIQVTEQEVVDVLRLLDSNKATGADGIPARILKEAGVAISKPLAKLFNISLQSGKVPVEWKMANVIPIFKKGDKHSASNYRPISLLSIVNKLIEKIIFKHLFNHLRDYNILSKLQSGFIPNDSTVCQLTYLYHIFSKALDDKKDVQIAFCDVSKAFDRVWHKGLLHKLNKYGVEGPLLKWFSDYLSERQQRVTIEGKSSNWGLINAGVPQGSTLGPLLFLVYINDITENIIGNIRLFADDTILFNVVDSPVTSSEILNRDLETINKWAQQWLVSFNPNKTELLYITKKRNPPTYPPITFNHVQINEVDRVRHLGLTLSKDLTWSAHIESIATNATRRLALLNKCKSILSRGTLETMYTSYIRPTLEYGSIVWNNCSTADSERLENIQLQAARIVTGAPRGTSHDKLYNELGWSKLVNRREYTQLIMFYKMYHNQAPNYLNHLVPPSVSNTTYHNLRNSNNLIPCLARTENFKNSFLNNATRLWNNLSADLRTTDTLSQFKLNLKSTMSLTKTKRKYFYMGKRKNNILFSQLRLGMSSLGLHLHSRHLQDNSLCDCGSVEDVNHFFFKCNKYNTVRALMLTDLLNINIEPNINSVLYGSNCDETNLARLHNIVETYIENTTRFN